MTRCPGPAFLAMVGCAALLSLTLGGAAASADDDDRYEYRSDYRDDDDRYDDDRYEYRSGYRDDDDRYEYRSGYRDDDDDRYEYRSGGRYDDDEKPPGGDTSATASLYSHESWGIWAVRHDGPGQSLLFAAGMFRVGPWFFPAIAGTPSGTNPFRGSAVWEGDVLAFELDPNAPPVRGDATLTVDFGGGAVDVDFTGLTRGHADIAWRGLALVDGAFRHRDRSGSIDGAFYGNRHQAAAGQFERNALHGVFGALRR